MDIATLIEAAVKFGAVAGGLYTGVSLALKRLRTQGESITASLAKDLRATTPNPDDTSEGSAANLPDGQVVLAALGAEVKRSVQAAMIPTNNRLQILEARIGELAENVELLMHDAELVDRRLDSHSGQLEAVRASTGSFEAVRGETIDDEDP